MRRLLFIFLLFPCVIYAQTNYYVALTGDDGNSGTSLEQAWRTWEYAFPQLTAGDTLFIRGGVYYSDTALVSVNSVGGLGASGTYGNPIVVMGYPDDINNTSDTTWLDGQATYRIGNYPVLDCYRRCDSLPETGKNIYNGGIAFNQVEFWELRNLVVRNTFQCDSVLTGAITGTDCANFTFENITIYNSGQRGYWFTSGAWNLADTKFAAWLGGDDQADTITVNDSYFNQPDSTYWINCDVWNCMDTLRTEGNRGNGGDAWKTVSYNGNYSYFEGCRAWNYSDDGFDPNNGTRVFQNCWAMASSKYSEFDGYEANGIKTSALRSEMFQFYSPEDSAQIVNDSLVRTYNCLAIFCDGRGFYHGLESDTSANERWYNNTAYMNGVGFAIAGFNPDTMGYALKNNIAYGATINHAGGGAYEVDIMNTSGYDMAYTCENNTWVRAAGYPCFDYNPAFTVTDDDFVTVDSLTLVSLFTAARQADGSLPTNKPMMLAATSDLIDGGTDVGLPYANAAPDLGYAEYGGDSIPVAAFSADDVTIFEGESVTFTDASTNTPTSWSWSFAGGSPSTSSDQNPTITYNTAGTYTVSLTATNEWGSDTETKTNYITVDVQPSGEFPPASQEKKILIRVR